MTEAALGEPHCLLGLNRVASSGTVTTCESGLTPCPKRSRCTSRCARFRCLLLHRRTDTSVEHDHVETLVDGLAYGADAPVYNFDLAGTTVSHVTEFADGRFTVSFTANLGFVAVPVDPGRRAMTARSG